MFRNARVAIVATALALAACGSASQPVVTNGDITKHLETQGYSKILVRDSFSCGKAGKGRHFIATKGGTVRTGQVCFLKANGKVTYAVDELGTAKPKSSNDNSRATAIPNPWKPQ